MIVAIISPIATFIGVEWRNERRQMWEAARLRAERESTAAILAIERAADREEREEVAKLVRMELETEAAKLREAVAAQTKLVVTKHDEIRRELSTNTEITKQAAKGAQKAFDEANTVNQKIAQQSELARSATIGLARMQQRFDELIASGHRTRQDDQIDAIKESTDTIEESTADTNARIRNMENAE